MNTAIVGNSVSNARTNRRTFLRRGVGVGLGIALSSSLVAPQNTQAAVPSNIGAAEAMQRLIDGNNRFVTNQLARPNQSEIRRSEVARGQQPFATIVSCVDSRVPPELVFDQGFGDLFVLRVAGNISNDDILGSIEFGIAEFQIPLIVVVGHSRCGAIVAAMDAIRANAQAPGHIGSLVEAIRPAVIATQEAENRSRLLGRSFSEGFDSVDFAVRANAIHTANSIRSAQPIISEAVASGGVEVAAMTYSLDTGKIELLR